MHVPEIAGDNYFAQLTFLRANRITYSVEELSMEVTANYQASFEGFLDLLGFLMLASCTVASFLFFRSLYLQRGPFIYNLIVFNAVPESRKSL